MSRNSVRRETNGRRITEVTEAVALTTDGAVINSSVLMIKVRAAQMKTVIAAVQEFDRQIEQLCQSHQDFFIFDSLPGAGPVYASRLCAAFGTDRERWSRVEEVLCLSGVALVIERSGKSEWIRWRYFCPKFLRQSLVEYAGESIRRTFLGTGLLRSATEEGEVSSSGGESTGFQMDQDHLEVLADANRL